MNAKRRRGAHEAARQVHDHPLARRRAHAARALRRGRDRQAGADPALGTIAAHHGAAARPLPRTRLADALAVDPRAGAKRPWLTLLIHSTPRSPASYGSTPRPPPTRSNRSSVRRCGLRCLHGFKITSTWSIWSPANRTTGATSWPRR